MYNDTDWEWTDLGLNPSLRGDRPATNHLKEIGPIKHAVTKYCTRLTFRFVLLRGTVIYQYFGHVA
jgi:hypothetical protein